MIVMTQAQIDARRAELEGATFHKFDDVVTIVGTGVYDDLPKDVKQERTHRLVADALVKKGYAKIV